jgi:glycosyltransferase involved in cell wall biosynthesis
MKIALIIPCYNEADNIAAFIHSLCAFRMQSGIDFSIVVVNDCSIDATGALLKRLPCLTLTLPINLGIGGAVQTGFRYAFEHGYDVAVQMDGDGQHPATELPKLLRVFAEQKPDIVIGSRFVRGEGFQSTPLRRIGIRYFTFLIKALTGKKITDPTSGFRALNRRAMAIVNSYYPNEFPEPEILIHFLAQDLKVVETPVIMQERNGGVSSIRSWKSVYYMLKVTAGILFSQFRMTYHAKP